MAIYFNYTNNLLNNIEFQCRLLFFINYANYVVTIEMKHVFSSRL
jgi:hypothetical protein